MRTITIETEVDVDLDDYRDEFWKILSDNELLEVNKTHEISRLIIKRLLYVI